MNCRYKIASVHGRFQIFHSDHLQYVRLAYERCEHLYIGVTGLNDFFATKTTSENDHRNQIENNPFTYFERITMIRLALLSEGFDLNRISFTPFPIETPNMLNYFLDTNVLCFTTIREKWNQTKISVLEKYNYQVDVLFENYNKQISGSLIRSLIRKKKQEWKQFVPQGTTDYLINEHGLLKIRPLKTSKNL